MRLVDDEGEMVGVVALAEALDMADEKGMDLVELSPNAEPPVCKVMDFGKYKYQSQKRAHDARKKQKIIVVKEIKVRPNIGEHDYQIKLRSLNKFIAEGNKVRISLRFRGREITHKDVGMKIFQRFQKDTAEIAKVETSPRMEGRQMLMLLVPR